MTLKVNYSRIKESHLIKIKPETLAPLKSVAYIKLISCITIAYDER